MSVYHKLLVAIREHGRAVRDEYHGMLFAFEDIAQQAALRLAVERRRSLIKHEHGAVAQQRTRYRYALCLTF